MKKTVVIFALVFGCYSLSNAQSPEELASSRAVQETQEVQVQECDYPEDVLTKSMTSSLSKQGKSLGVINNDGSIYVIGSATTARPSNMSGFINSRNVAYSIAELTAKQNLLRMAGEQITSGRGFTMLEDIIEGEDPEAAAQAQKIENAEKIKNKSIDAALDYLGVPRQEYSSLSEPQKKVKYKQCFSSATRSLVAGMVSGCAVVRIAEGEMGKDDYQISVCMKYSPEFQSFASLIKRGGMGNIPMGTAKDSRSKILNMSTNDLVLRLGVWQTYNDKGEMVIFGFGQQEVLETGSRQSAAFSRAYSQARLQAVNNIKNFVAEDIVAEEAIESQEKLEEYADGSNAYFSRQKWENAVKAKSTTLNIATEQVRQWKGTHPTSGKDVAGFVVAWTYTNAKQANKLKQQLNNSNLQDPSQNSTAPRQQTTKGVITVTGSDDDL